MIPVKQLEKRAEKLKEDIDHAKVYMGERVTDGAILKVKREGTLVTAFVSLSDDMGVITLVELYDKDGDMLVTRNVNIEKTPDIGYMAVVEIDVRNEVR
ncbi:MAG: hypothetical protein SPI65_06705 [Peptoniphilus sp.]|nr:hypothetical protein [Peptoniphilus sp.]MDY6045245.1 hypothetical protein [Peptoniphilus sp.]